MAGDRPIFEVGLKAGGDLSTKEFYLMKAHTTEGQVTTCTAITDLPVGSLYDPAESNEAGAPINLAVPAPGHPVKVLVGAAGVTPGRVSTDTAGKLINTTTDKHNVFGQVFKTYAAADIALVYYCPPTLSIA